MDGRAGAGVYSEKLQLKQSYQLGQNVTVFQAEVFAVLKALQQCLASEISQQNIVICSDSQAAIRAICSAYVNSGLVKECQAVLQEVAKQNMIDIVWVPGHSGVPGNEAADQLARNGSSKLPCAPEPVLKIASSSVIRAIENELMHRFRQHWKEQSLRQSKVFLKGPCKKMTRQLLQLKRSDLRVLTALLTGHGPFYRHLYNMGLSETPLCRFCELEDETGCHLLRDCPALSFKRWRCTGETDVPIQQILKFSRETKMADLWQP